MNWSLLDGIVFFLFGCLSILVSWYSHKHLGVCWPWSDEKGAWKTTVFWLIMAIMVLFPIIRGAYVIIFHLING